MSDVSSAQAEPQAPDLSPEAFGLPEEGEVRSTPEKPIAPEQQATTDEGEPEQADETQETDESDPYAEAPEFWSKERKAVYAKITDPEARQAIHEQEKERIAATNKKIEEAALEKKTYAEKVAQYEQEREQVAAYWRDTGPKLAAAFRSKWEGVDWNKLSAENPAEWARQKQEYENDTALIRQAAENNEREQRAAGQRAAQSLAQAKRAAHEEVAKKYPDHFGKPDVAQKTYDEIRDYLVEQGVPQDRIPNIYEPFVVGTALKAMLYDRAQKAAKDAKANPQPSTTATLTPRRIVPGASTRSQPSQNAAQRQAHERLKNGEPLSREDAGLLFA